MLSDATGCETGGYPTEVKLLWECCEWLYGQMRKTCKAARFRLPHNKYAEQKTKYLSYQKNRKKSHKQKRRKIKRLLYLLNKLSGQIDQVAPAALQADIKLPLHYYTRRTIINKVNEQQTYQYQAGEHPKDKIVSIDKHYIRPIVIGKEVKRVEFGAKINMIQVDGINFIERLSFDAFH